MDFSDEELNVLALAMQQQHVMPGETIIRQGDDGDFFYLVQSGQVDFVNNGKMVGSCTSGGSFGELALLYNAPRAVSCIASQFQQTERLFESPTTPTILWKVDRMTFRCIVAHNVHQQTNNLKEHVVRDIELFKNMPKPTICRFVSAMTRVHWKAGEQIVQKGQEGKVFYIITQGKVKVHDIGLGDSKTDDQYLEAGQCFGEESLLTGEVRIANVTAVTDVITMAMDRGTFEDHIGPIKNVVERNMRMKFLTSLPLIQNSNLTEPEINLLVDQMVEVCYTKGEFLAEPGKPYQMKLWIIRHGSLFVYSSKHTEKFYNLQSGDYFGDKSIRGDPTHIGSYTAVCEENLTAWMLTREDIERVIGDIERLGNPVEFVKSRRDESILLTDLVRHRMLGMGAFGKVWLVSHRETKAPFALKYISKRKLIEQQQVKSSIREKELLCNLNHPFILHLVASYQDESNLYLLMPIIPGGELYSQVEKRKSKQRGLPHTDAAFYAACIIEALGHFHQRHIAYRDLKLENILIDEDGYCVVVDLGFAKVVADKTFTLVGTPEYIAPEIIMSKGHDSAADYWSYGVLIYELLVGFSPFSSRRGSDNRMEMFKRIVLGKYNIPDYVDEEAQALIRQLLVRYPHQRLGNLANGYLDIKKSGWFINTGINFNLLLKKEIAAPWKPKFLDPLDLKETFDDFHAQEKEIDYGRRLTKEEQELFSAF